MDEIDHGIREHETVPEEKEEKQRKNKGQNQESMAKQNNFNHCLSLEPTLSLADNATSLDLRQTRMMACFCGFLVP